MLEVNLVTSTGRIINVDMKRRRDKCRVSCDLEKVVEAAPNSL